LALAYAWGWWTFSPARRVSEGGIHWMRRRPRKWVRVFPSN
jgi:hypothetical protein